MSLWFANYFVVIYLRLYVSNVVWPYVKPGFYDQTNVYSLGIGQLAKKEVALPETELGSPAYWKALRATIKKKGRWFIVPRDGPIARPFPVSFLNTSTKIKVWSKIHYALECSRLHTCPHRDSRSPPLAQLRAKRIRRCIKSTSHERGGVKLICNMTWKQYI